MPNQIMDAPIPATLFRCWSTTSAGQLRSGRLQQQGRRVALSEEELLDEFVLHADLRSRRLTALVSTTKNFLRVVHIAFERAHLGESADSIVIAFIDITRADATTVHHAGTLARRLNFQEPSLFDSEYIFEWEIPQSAITHTVAVSTLYERNLSWPLSGLKASTPFPQLKELKEKIANGNASIPPYYAGFDCGIVACKFGIWAPVEEIAWQISRCCKKGHYSAADWTEVDEGISDSIEECRTAVAEENFYACEGELGKLNQEFSELEEAHMEMLADLGYELQLNPDDTSLRHEIDGRCEEYEQSKKSIVAAMEQVYTDTGC